MTDPELGRIALHAIAWRLSRAKISDAAASSYLAAATDRALASGDPPGQALFREYEALILNGVPGAATPRGVLRA